MKEPRKINMASLRRDAEKSEDKEAFSVLDKTPRYRIGVGARIESRANSAFFVEIIINLCASRQQVNLRSLESNLVGLKQLKKRGYRLTCEGDGTIACELSAESEKLNSECDAACLILEKCVNKNEQSIL